MEKDIVKSYVRYLKLQRNMSPNTLDAYQRDLRKLLDYLEHEEKDARDVTLEDLEAFSAGLHDIGIHPRSQCRILSGVRAFFRFLHHSFLRFLQNLLPRTPGQDAEYQRNNHQNFLHSQFFDCHGLQR